MRQSLHALSAFEYQLGNRPNQLAIQDDFEQLSYAGLNARIRVLVEGFQRLGLGPDDRIAIVAKNRAVTFAAILASLLGGPVVVPVNRRVSAAEMAWIIGNAGCKLVMADSEAAAMLDVDADFRALGIAERLSMDGDGSEGWPLWSECINGDGSDARCQPLDSEQDYLQIYTSGTSGRPKGVVLTAGNCLAQSLALMAGTDVVFQPVESLYQALPLFHVGGVFCSVWAVSRGLSIQLRQDFDPTYTAEWLASGEIQHAGMVPAMIQACLQATEADPRGYDHLKTIIYGASPISRTTLINAARRYGCGFMQIYGMTETHSVISSMSCADHERIIDGDKPELVASAGRPVVGTQLTIRDPEGQPVPQGEVGEICVASDHLMSGYWANPEATADSLRDGALYTGDAGYIDDEGYLFIVDRLKDIIVSGGENISSLEVESALIGHPDVIDVAVIGVPDERWGEAVLAIVVLAPGKVLDSAAIKAHCQEHLGAFKVPKRYEQVDVIPRNAAGKILKAALRKAYWGSEGRAVA